MECLGSSSLPNSMARDAGEKDVGRAVFGQGCRRGEDRREAASSDGRKSLVFAQLMPVARRWQSPDVERTGEVGLLPGPASTAGVGEPRRRRVGAASPGRSLRRSYQVTPTVPRASTAIEGRNANAVTPDTAMEVQVLPPSRDRAIPIPPDVTEVSRSVACRRSALGNPGCGYSS